MTDIYDLDEPYDDEPVEQLPKYWLPDGVYDVLKWVALVACPLVAVIYPWLAEVWGLPLGQDTGRALRRNIAPGVERIDKERLRHAAQVANIHRFVEELPPTSSWSLGEEEERLLKILGSQGKSTEELAQLSQAPLGWVIATLNKLELAGLARRWPDLTWSLRGGTKPG